MKEGSHGAISVLTAALPSCITSYHRIRFSKAVVVGKLPRVESKQSIF